MSSPAATSGRNWAMRIGLVVLLVGTAWFFWPDLSEYLNPAHLAGVREIVDDADAEIETDAAAVREKLAGMSECKDDDGLTVWNCWGDGRRPLAYHVARGQDERDLQIAIATRSTPRNAIEIPWNRGTWTPLPPIDTPAWIMVSYRDGQKEDMDPRGIYPEGKPSHYQYNKTAAEAEGVTAWIPYQAPLIRHRRSGEIQQLISGSLLCENAGGKDVFFNEFTWQAGSQSSQAFYYHGEGRAYYIWFLKNAEAAEACKKIGQPAVPGPVHVLQQTN